MIQGKLLDDIGWIAKVNEESTKRKEKSEYLFSDSLCQEIDFCKNYVDPDDQLQLDAEEEVTPVFF